MDEEADLKKNNVDENLRNAVNSELTSFTNPKATPDQNKIVHAILEQKIDLGIQNALKPKSVLIDFNIKIKPGDKQTQFKLLACYQRQNDYTKLKEKLSLFKGFSKITILFRIRFYFKRNIYKVSIK